MAINTIGSNTLTQTANNIQQTSERIASGSHINSAADDAAGLVISNRLSTEIQEQSQAGRNANDGISYLQVAGGAFENITQGLDRIRELALQASNGVLSESDRGALNTEAQELKAEIQSSVKNTSFNGQTILNTNQSVSIVLGSDEGAEIDISLANFEQSLEELDFENIDLSSVASAQQALSIVDDVQTEVDNSNSQIGAQTNRLESSIDGLFSRELEAVSSRSRIQDADLAKEISELSANQIQSEVAIALRVQANEQAKGVLRLLGE
ncbi:flagellin [Agaribacterium sp. ZY112]|uniref:flagellin N-terminal helical domain-containing protein n=1 Tax=Agaribacterium sp. ZY112 TaxID=3233574 RepID=UPI0035238AD3